MVVLTLQGNPSVMDVDRLKLEIQQHPKEDGVKTAAKTENYSLRLLKLNQISLEVGREIIVLLKLLLPHEWNELIIDDCSGARCHFSNASWIEKSYLWGVIDTIYKMNVFRSISYCQHQTIGSSCSSLATKNPFATKPSRTTSIVRFENHASLQTLKLCVHKLGHQFAIALRKALQETSSLLELKVRVDSFFCSKVALCELAKGINGNSSVRVLDLSDNNFCITESALSDLIINSVFAHPTLESLDLSRNLIGVSLLKGLGRALSYKDCKISELRMHEIAPWRDIDMGQFFDNVIPGNSSLKVLDLSANRLVNHSSISYILENVHKLQGLEELILSRCTTVDVVRDFPMESHQDQNMPKSLHLRHLDLSMAALRESSLESILCFCSHHFPMLKSLNVAKNGITVLDFPNYLSDRNPPMAELTKLDLGFIQSWMLPGLSKVVAKLPKLIYVGRGCSMFGYRRKNHIDEWHAIQLELDTRRFPVSRNGEILPLTLWPIVFQKVNAYFGDKQNRLIEFLFSIVHGPAMPLLRIALKNQEKKDYDV